MRDYYLKLFEQYRNQGIIVDANLLLLYFIGSYDNRRIGGKKLQKFTIENFQLLAFIIAFFRKIVTTPNILTEVSNLSSNALPEKMQPDYFRRIAQQIPLLDEVYSESKQVSSLPAFSKFGLADAAIIYEAPQKYLVLTDEFPLFGYLQSINVDAVNFNNLRHLNWSNWLNN